MCYHSAEVISECASQFSVNSWIFRELGTFYGRHGHTFSAADVIDFSSVAVFRRHLKTFLFFPGLAQWLSECS